MLIDDLNKALDKMPNISDELEKAIKSCDWVEMRKKHAVDIIRQFKSLSIISSKNSYDQDYPDEEFDIKNSINFEESLDGNDTEDISYIDSDFQGPIIAQNLEFKLLELRISVEDIRKISEDQNIDIIENYVYDLLKDINQFSDVFSVQYAGHLDCGEFYNFDIEIYI